MENVSPKIEYTGLDVLEIMDQAVRYNASLVHTIQQHFQDTPAVTDFGAGTGFFAKSVQAASGATVSCIEADPYLHHQLLKAGFQSHQNLNALADSSVAGIYTLNVLEHIEDDQSTLRDFFRVLAPGAKLLIYVPAFPVLYTEFDRRLGHFRRYRLAELRTKAQAAGFQIQHCSYWDSLGFWAALTYKWIGNKEGKVDPKKVWVYDRFIFPISRILDPLFGKIFGKNLLLLATKPTNRA